MSIDRTAPVSCGSPGSVSLPARGARPRPNILVILADDLGYSDIIDLMPTCVELAGASYPGAMPPMEGRGLAAAFAGGAIRRRTLYWEHEGNRAIRIGKWKAVAVDPAGTWELYDLERDRTEMHNLAEAQPRRLRAMIAQWERWARRPNVLPWIWKPPYGSAPREEKRT